MSFFGFDPALPGRGHNTSALGFSQAADPFAELQDQSGSNDALDFEDYDGLADQLDERDDALNRDTFGAADMTATRAKPVGKDFDFFGQTAKVSNAITEEQMRYSRQQPVAVSAVPMPAAGSYSTKPARTGYEKYATTVPDMRVDASLWGVTPKQPTPAPVTQPSAPSRKMMSLEEVEAAMRAQTKKPATPMQAGQQRSMTQISEMSDAHTPPIYQHHVELEQQMSHPMPPQQNRGSPIRPVQGHVQPTLHPQGPLRQASTTPPHSRSPSQPMKILQNPSRHSLEQSKPAGPQQGHMSRPSGPRQIITHPQQLAGLSMEERAQYIEEEAKRAKRNHKIFLLSKDNGLMTPQDKNFITRIQLQQLITATGNPREHGSDPALAEDFYYQVHNQIRGGPRQHPGQPLSNFAQTYLFQTGGRHGGQRRHNRGPDNHVQRMEQQVQRAVEAAKNKPKNKQLVIEGSLGKISFSNAKTPKPLLNLKRADSGADVRPGSSSRDRKTPVVSGFDRRAVLADVELVYIALMQLEDHDRCLPPPITPDAPHALVDAHVEWRNKAQELNQKLWTSLKVHEPIGATSVHPFIAFLSFSKGKKTIPRVFRHVTPEQRTTIMTMIILHLDQLDVISKAHVMPGEVQVNAQTRENIELFSLTVMPALFTLLNESAIVIVTGVLGLILSRNVELIARTRIGMGVLAMILSRAELVKQAGEASEQEWQQWSATCDKLFDRLEPVLGHVFPDSVNSGEDVHVWQFLAAIGIGASPEQQQRLVMAVKDRVMETVNLAKTLPPAMSSQRLANVNLFMRSIGLDVELLA